jgi:TonB family protein
MSAIERRNWSAKASFEVSALSDRPGGYALWLSFAFHFVILVSLLLPRHPAVLKISPLKAESAQLLGGKSALFFRPNTTSDRQSQVYIVSRTRPARASKQSSVANGAGEALGKEAQRQTAALMQSLKFRQIYGFFPGSDYRLPIRRSGEFPPIRREQFPNQVQQFVVVDITIDNQGTVADARIVAGIVDPAIQRILLSAAHDFKYVPAKRDGRPIPSQLELVVFVPS